MKFYLESTSLPVSRGWRGFMEYASVQNVIRYGLRKPGLPPGQYDIYRITGWAGNNDNYQFVCTTYKLV